MIAFLKPTVFYEWKNTCWDTDDRYLAIGQGKSGVWKVN